jgi:cytochrome c oxidase cbb3-type subunit 3/ubiquinol-cytochrome c reductase cytochrome c subunit
VRGLFTILALFFACKARGEPVPPTPGAALYAKYCALCHAKDATGYAADNAPSLVNATFLASVSDDFLRTAIKLGRPGTAMAGYDVARGGPLTAQDVAQIVAHLRSGAPRSPPLFDRPPTGNAERGAAVWKQHCFVCHGDRTTRGDAVHLANPQFIGSAPDVFLRYAVEHGRPGTRMPAFSATLGAAAIDDVVAHIRTWDPKKAVAPAPASLPVVPTNLPQMRFPNGPPPSLKLRDDRFVAADDVKAALDKKSRLIVLDARAVPDWMDGRIPGALPAPYYDFKNLDGLPKDGTWIVAYCACPHHASGAVVDELRRRGYKNTAVMDEGILVWKQRGYPTENGAPPASPARARE